MLNEEMLVLRRNERLSVKRLPARTIFNYIIALFCTRSLNTFSDLQMCSKWHKPSNDPVFSIFVFYRTIYILLTMDILLLEQGRCVLINKFVCM